VTKNKKQRTIGNSELLGDDHLKKKKKIESIMGTYCPSAMVISKTKKTRELRATPPLLCVFEWCCQFFFKK